MDLEKASQFMKQVMDLGEIFQYNSRDLAQILMNLVGLLIPDAFDEEDMRTYVHQLYKLFVEIKVERKNLFPGTK